MRAGPSSVGKTLLRLQDQITPVDLFFRLGPPPHLSQCPTTGISKAVVCAFISVGASIK